MPEKRAKPSVKEMSQTKHDLLQQALQQVKVLKARLESSEQVDTSKGQQAFEQIDSLKKKLSLVEHANKKLQQTVQEAEELNAELEVSERTKYSALEQQVQTMKQEVQSLKEENARLKRQLEKEPTATAKSTQLTIELLSPAVDSKGITKSKAILSEESARPHSEKIASPTLLSPHEKVTLFAGLFARRRDQYAERWESHSSGKNGYSPAREHYEFHGKRPCPGPPACPNLPLTDNVLKEHLQGKKTIGVYPMLEDETCVFVAIDLDQKNKNRITECLKATEPWREHAPVPKRELDIKSERASSATDSTWSWKDDARALMNAARNLGVPAYLEQSRSGNGAHVWVFFEEPVTAAMARRLAEALVTKAERDTGQLGLRSYDRMFPNQDTMPKKGYGNLIALPLQKVPLAVGNSAFLDQSMAPFEDQWSLLHSVRKMTATAVEALVREATRQNAVMSVDQPSEKEEADDKLDPWALPPSGKRKEDGVLIPPLPSHVAITLCNFVYVSKAGLTRSQLNCIERLAAFQNPTFYRNQNLRLSNYKTPRIISCAEEFPEHIALPRGCLDELTNLLDRSGVPYSIDDKRFLGKKIRAKFKGKLRDNQKQAAQQLLTSEMGILYAVPGFGKTVIAAFCISKRKVNTLVLVHRQQLLDQWRERLSTFLELPPSSIGQIGGGKKKPTGIIDVAMVQSLNEKGVVDDLVAEYGQVIVDECHGVGSVKYEQVLRQVKAKWILGLTATPVRHDGHHPIIVMQCGPIRYRIRHRDVDTGIAEHIVLPRFTATRLPEHAQHFETQEIITELVNDEQRNQMIVDDVLKCINERRMPLVLTKRKEHLQLLRERFEGKVKNIIVYHGGLSIKKRKALTKQLEAAADERLVLAIGDCIGEGFDDSRLDTLFLALPISFHGRLEQYVGRLHREHEGKSVVKIYDYTDAHIEKMYRMFKKRQAAYKKIGYKMEMPLQNNT